MLKICNINEETLQDIINIETGVLYPLNGFMVYKDYKSVIENYTLSDGQVWTIPITLDINENLYSNIKYNEKIQLMYKDKQIGYVEVEDKFQVTQKDIFNIFRTIDESHPGVLKEKSKSIYRVGGKTTLTDKGLLSGTLEPDRVKSIFKNKGWKTVAGFQTRNPIHKAHEYLQRIGLEICDGLFINPLVGWKKKGDFTQDSIVAAYNVMLQEFYPSNRVYFEELKTQMRYAGPREAIFHAIIRRNLGCTHFIIGRDHAGVGNFYEAYDAHKLAKDITSNYDLGIELLLMREPYFCKVCNQIVSDRTCKHSDTDRIEISGTIIRQCISNNNIPDEMLMRKEVSEAILNVKNIFI